MSIVEFKVVAFILGFVGTDRDRVDIGSENEVALAILEREYGTWLVLGFFECLI